MFDKNLDKNFELPKTNVIKSLKKGGKVIFLVMVGVHQTEHLATEFIIKFKNTRILPNFSNYKYIVNNLVNDLILITFLKDN